MEFDDASAYDEFMALANWDENTVMVDSYITPIPDCLRTPDGLTYKPDDASTCSSDSPSKEESKKKRPTRSVNLSRERRKQELDYLRKLVFDLQSELNTLQRRREEMLRPHLAADTGELMTTAPVWEDMAKRQFQARRKSESETVRLKTLLAAQAQVAQDLINVLQRAKGIEQDAIEFLPIEPLEDQPNTIPEQLKRLQILCAQWFVAFSWYPILQSGPLRMFESKVVSDDGRDTVVDIYSNQAYPFAVSDVENAIWAMFQAEITDEKYAYTQDCEVNDDTLVGKFTAATYKEGARATLRGTYTTRRFRNEQGHFLMASHVYAVPVLSSNMQAGQDFVMTEDTWIRIIDARELQGSVALTESTPALTVLQHVRRSRYRFKNIDHRTDERVQTLMKVHYSLVEEELRWGQQTIESMLMRGFNTSDIHHCE